MPIHWLLVMWPGCHRQDWGVERRFSGGIRQPAKAALESRCAGRTAGAHDCPADTHENWVPATWCRLSAGVDGHMAVEKWNEEGRVWEADHGLLDEEQVSKCARADEADLFRSPVPTRMVSNGEYMPAAQTKKQRQVEA